MIYVYVIRSGRSNTLYKGITKSLSERVKQHNWGKPKSTKGLRPWSLVYFEVLKTISEARKRELFLKSVAGREYLKTVLSSFPEIPIKGPIVQGIE